MTEFKLKSFFIRTVFIVTIFIFNLNLLKAEDDKDKIEILFIGNSYFIYNNLPALVDSLAINSGKDIYIFSYSLPGTSLAEHIESDIVRTKINERDWEYVILIGSGAEMAYPEYFLSSHTSLSLLEFKNRIEYNCSSTKMIFCMSWAYEDGIIFSDGTIDTYEGMQNAIYDNTLLYSNTIGFEIAPVGWAWYKVLEEKGYPLHYLHRPDWNHPSLRGSYIMACVVYTTIFQETTVGNKYYADLPVDEASYLQNNGSTIVLDNIDLWNIDIPSSNNDAGINKSLPQLYQNYLNPFYLNTMIRFDIYESSFVEITVYNILGKLVANLIKKQMIPGSYSINFDSENLENGVYFYSIKTQNYFQTKKMQLINK